MIFIQENFLGELPAGRELDRMVAERILQWRYAVGSDVKEEHSHQGLSLDEQEGWYTPKGEFQCLHCGDGPRYYSELIDAAWEVVDFMWPCVQGGGHGTFRIQLSREDHKGEWICSFAIDPQGDWSTQAEARADSAPLAICRAALIAAQRMAPKEERPA